MPNATGAKMEVRRLTKVFGGGQQPAVDSVDLSIRPGEFMTLLGPSGSGKTTTLNMIAGFESVTSGQILLDDLDIAALPAYRRNLGMVFQNYALFPHMSAAANIAFPLEQRRVPRTEIRSRVAEALDLVRLSQYHDRLPAQLSGGQQQRVALARAVVFSPRALLLDEPFGALDKKLREQLQTEIARLHRELGLTFIFVTHDQEEALALSDRIAVFNEGRIQQVGTAKTLYEQPESRFVASFLGDSNMFSGRVSSTDDALDTSLGRLRLPATNRLPDRAPAALVVRPEHLRIDATATGPSRNTLSASVTGVVYQGAFRKVQLRFDDGQTGLVREGSGTASSTQTDDRVEVSWDSRDGVVVPDETEVEGPAPNGHSAELSSRHHAEL